MSDEVAHAPPHRDRANGVDPGMPFDGGQGQDLDRRMDQQVPDAVADYLIFFYNSFRNRATTEMQNWYENAWPALSDKYYHKSRWPEVEVVERIIGDYDAEEIFFVVYKWLYYRHIYERLKFGFSEIFDCYTNYCNFFNHILNFSREDGPRDIDLPTKLVWDILDDFLVQFENVSLLRRKPGDIPPADMALLMDKPETWDVHCILNVLYSLIHTSRINEQLIASTSGGDISSSAGPCGMKPLYRILGYSSLVCLMRVQCSLGDYSLALKAVENVDFGKKSLLSRPYSCNVTAYYYLGFTYMMLRRYSDAVNTFVHLLLYISRTKISNPRAIAKEGVLRKGDCAYALLAICASITRQRIDESIHNVLREKYGESIAKMQRESEDAVEIATNLFAYACPVFISPREVDLDVSVDTSLVPLNHQIGIFMSEVREQLFASSTASRLRYYTAVDLEKLSLFFNRPMDQIISELIVFKNRCTERRKLSDNSQDGSSSGSEIDFYISEGVLHVFKEKQARRIGDWLIRNTNKLNEIVAALR